MKRRRGIIGMGRVCASVAVSVLQSGVYELLLHDLHGASASG